MKLLKRMPAIGLTLLLGTGALITLLPIVLTITNSLMTEQEIGLNYDLLGQMTNVAAGEKEPFVNLKWIPDWVSLDQYAEVLVRNPKFLHMFWNSVGMVVPIVVGQAAIASLAAYAFAKLRFRGRDNWFLFYLLTMLMPFQVTLVPNYIILDKLGLLNSKAAILLPGIFGAFGVFLLRQFMIHIPGSLTEAARMDGAGHGTIFVRIMLPLIRPGIAALTLLLFVDYWNMVEQPLIFIQDAVKQPLSLYLTQIGKEARGVVFAASVLFMSPMVLLFLYAQTNFIEGVQLSGIKA
ncbi:carbohydrate ABC transporter permease [Paenibacillus sp. MBLB4367]|uniref:carbohydrate ABC transporter permease n=1 Tax=Paenibacillus sp. MBLB4367 TaxID=3384767 RepID=UPI0039082D23